MIHFHIQVAILEESLDFQEAANRTVEEGQSLRSLPQDRAGLEGATTDGFLITDLIAKNFSVALQDALFLLDRVSLGSLESVL